MKAFLQYLKIPMDAYPGKSVFRTGMYAAESVLISLAGYLWLEYTRMDGIFKSIYPVIMAGIISVSQYLLVESGGRRILRRWRGFKINVGIFWGISFCGAVFGFIMVYFNAQCPGIKAFYPDIFYFYTSHPDPVPSRMAVFYKILLVPWLITTFLMTLEAVKRKVDQEFADIREINRGLLEKKLSPRPERPERVPETIADFELNLTDRQLRIPCPDILTVSVKDHYCELVFRSEGEIRRELLRLSLKEVLAALPSDAFEQVHRSHVVNLRHVEKITKKGQAFRLVISESGDIIPASRHRAGTFLPKISQQRYNS